MLEPLLTAFNNWPIGFHCLIQPFGWVVRWTICPLSLQPPRWKCSESDWAGWSGRRRWRWWRSFTFATERDGLMIECCCISKPLSSFTPPPPQEVPGHEPTMALRMDGGEEVVMVGILLEDCDAVFNVSNSWGGGRLQSAFLIIQRARVWIWRVGHLTGLLIEAQLYWCLKGSSCSTAVEHLAHNRESLGLSSSGCRAYFSPSIC